MAKYMKILFVSHEYNIGGSTMSLLSMIQGLRRHEEIEIEVLLPAKWNAKAKYLYSQSNISFTEMIYRRNYKRISEPYSMKFVLFDLINLYAANALANYIKRKHFDIVCSNSTGVDVGVRASIKAGIPHIYYVREFMEEDHGFEYRNKKCMKKFLEKSAYVIFISKAIEEKYCRLYTLKNTSKFYNGFISDNYYINNHRILINEKISFIQVGRFGDGKGTLNTIELLYQLKKMGIANWDMEFVGNGKKDYIVKMQQYIEKYHLESQITVGEFCNDMKEKLMCKDILIMNSRAEGFGRVTVEGMLAGCLVVGRNQGGTKEIISDEINGVTYEKDEDFIKKIKKVIEDRDRYIALAKKGQQYALEQFDCSKTAQNFMEVVKRCLS